MNAKFASLLAVVALAPAAALAQVTWNIQYLDGSGSGFNDPALGADRRQALEDVTSYVGSVLGFSATVDLSVQVSDNDAGSNTLASAGPLAFQVGGFTGGLLWTHASTGTDPSSSNPDANLTVNFGHDYYLGTGTPGTDQFDFRTVLLHELTHALGLLTFSASDGSSRVFTDAGGPDAYTFFDSNLYLGDGSVSAPEQLFPGAEWNVGVPVAALTGGDIWYHGAAGVAANGGAPIQIYAPSTWAQGSSLGHFQPGVDSIMVPSLPPETVRRTYSAIDLAVLQDLNWTAVPEPGPASVVILVAAVAAFRRRAA